jgi:hypothetical protein
VSDVKRPPIVSYAHRYKRPPRKRTTAPLAGPAIVTPKRKQAVPLTVEPMPSPPAIVRKTKPCNDVDRPRFHLQLPGRPRPLGPKLSRPLLAHCVLLFTLGRSCRLVANGKRRGLGFAPAASASAPEVCLLTSCGAWRSRSQDRVGRRRAAPAKRVPESQAVWWSC